MARIMETPHPDAGLEAEGFEVIMGGSADNGSDFVNSQAPQSASVDLMTPRREVFSEGARGPLQEAPDILMLSAHGTRQSDWSRRLSASSEYLTSVRP
jgi:hypothetical protein